MREQDTDIEELTRILLAVAPELRAAIRRGRRGAREIAPTSDIFSSMFRRTIAARPRLRSPGLEGASVTDERAVGEAPLDAAEPVDAAPKSPAREGVARDASERAGAVAGAASGATPPAVGSGALSQSGLEPTRQGWAFLHKVIRATLTDAWRRRAAHARQLQAARALGAAEASSTVEDPSMRSMAEEDRRRLGQAISGLAASDREILQLRLRGIGFATIAEMQGGTPQAARQRFLRIRSCLLAALDPDSGRRGG